MPKVQCSQSIRLPVDCLLLWQWPEGGLTEPGNPPTIYALRQGRIFQGVLNSHWSINRPRRNVVSSRFVGVRKYATGILRRAWFRGDSSGLIQRFAAVRHYFAAVHNDYCIWAYGLLFLSV